MAKVYAALFLGQGGETFSWGIDKLASDIRALGNTDAEVLADVLPWQDYRDADTRVVAKEKDGYKVALIGYSLGDSTVTYLQTIVRVDLLVCIAASSLAKNYKVDKFHTRRSVLFHGQDFLSNWGEDAGFDLKVELPWYDLHLGADVDPRVFSVTLDEVRKLVKS